MRALVISGGGSKSALAEGVAQYLMEVRVNQYDLLLGTSISRLIRRNINALGILIMTNFAHRYGFLVMIFRL